MSGRIEHIGSATLLLGDCRELLPAIDRPAAILSDPPYGQKVNTNVVGKGGIKIATPPGCGAKQLGRAMRLRSVPGAGEPRAAGSLHSTGSARMWPKGIVGDDQPFDPEHLLNAANKCLLWGAHKFGHLLPRGRWLAWDKVPTGKVRHQGDGELAWCSVDPDAVVRFHRLLWDGVCVGSAARHEVTAGQPREHPTQKPESLIAWSLGFLNLSPGEVVCDPYMGAGSTGMAVVKAGLRFVGIEIEPVYFEAACRRIEDAQRQLSLFEGSGA